MHIFTYVLFVILIHVSYCTHAVIAVLFSAEDVWSTLLTINILICYTYKTESVNAAPNLLCGALC